jgi:hypothetical protein
MARRRLAAVLGGYQTKIGREQEGRRPWRTHLDEDGVWWIWMDERQATALRGGGAAEQSLLHRRRLEFWTELLERANASSPLHHEMSPGVSNWVGTSAGTPGLGWNYTVTEDGTSGELYIGRGRGRDAENRRLFDALLADRTAIESAFGAPLSWEPLDGRRACRIACRLALGGWKTSSAEWPAVQTATVEAMTRLHEVLRPRLERLSI